MAPAASVLLAHGRVTVWQTTAAVHGVVTTQSGMVRLPGVSVSITPAGGGRPLVTVSNDDGAFRVSKLAPGGYTVQPALVGFEVVAPRTIVLAAGQDLEIDFNLELARYVEHVDVAERAAPVPTETAAAGDTVPARLVDVLPVKGDDYQAILPTVPGVVRGPDGRINMKGGRPTQTGLQVSNAYVTDPSTGSFGFELPLDAVDSVEVLPNPFAAEYGRFSSGVTRIETRRGGDQWQVTANSFLPIPCLTICDGVHWGIRSYDPRVMFGGPLVPKRVYLAQSFQLHHHKDMSTSLPVDEADTVLNSFDSFTRLDAAFGRHDVTTSLAFYPRNIDYVNINTFNTQPVTPNFEQRGFWTSLRDTATVSSTAVIESLFSVKRYDVKIAGQGSAPMQLRPGWNDGNYFNGQERDTWTIQGTTALTLLRKGRLGDHLLKFGVDVLRASYSGTSESRPVIVKRTDGTVAWRIDFSNPSHPTAASTDVAAFAQDRWRMNDRLLLELGLRLDRSGGIDDTSLAPRAGAVVSLLPEGRAVLRGGAGLFYEKTPLGVLAFSSFEQRTVTRFEADGITPASAPVRYANDVPAALRVPYGAVWNLEFDSRLPADLSLRVNELRRDGRREYVIDPVDRPGARRLVLASDGRSRYEETEVTVRYAPSDQRLVTATYVRSRSDSDTNAFDEFFGNFRNPVIRPRQFSRGSVDVPNRLVVSAIWPLPRHWSVSPLFEIRDGFPYTCVDQNQDYVGAVNQCGRFPTLYSLDVNITRTITVRRREVRIGVKTNHLLNNFSPRDVQTNVDSPAFGTFYNSFPRRFGFIIQLSPH